MGRVKILLADDHQIVLEGLKGLLAEEYEVVGLAENGVTLIKEALRLSPDVIIADISMPLLNGIDAVRQIRKEGLRPKIIFLTMHNDAVYAKEAMAIGASGFVLKHSASSELLTAVREAIRNNTYISPAIAQELSCLSKENSGIYKNNFHNLSLRQREVLQLLAEGNSAKEIARMLDITSRTVEFHKYTMMQHLNIKTSAELIHFAIKNGIVSI